MHELTLANNILRIITEHATKQKEGCVQEVEVVIGELSGVIIEALKAALQAVLRDTSYEHTQINLTTIKALAKCTYCHSEVNMDTFITICPKCQHTHLTIIQGKELYVKSITFD